MNFQAARDFSNDRFVTGEYTDVHEIDNVWCLENSAIDVNIAAYASVSNPAWIEKVKI